MSTDRPSSSNRIWSIAFAALIACGIALRLWHPWRALFWNDEVWTALQSTGHSLDHALVTTDTAREMHASDFLALQRSDPLTKLGRFLADDPHTSPVYYALCWAAIGLGGDHVVATRMLTAVIGCLGVLATYLAARELFGSRAALWAAAMASLSPAQLSLSYESRPYTLWLATTAFSTFACLRACRRPGLRSFALYGVSLVLLVHSHLYGLASIGAHLLYVVLARRSLLKPLLSTLGVALLLCVPWFASIFQHRAAVARLTGWLSRPLPLLEQLSAWKSPIVWQFSTFETFPIPARSSTLTVVVLLTALAALVWLFKKNELPRAALVAALLCGLPCLLLLADVVLGGRRFSIIRYQIPSWFGLTLLLGGFGSGLSQREARSGAAIRWSALGALGVISVLFALSIRGAWETFRARVPEGKPDGFVLDIADRVASARPAIIFSPGLVTLPLILSNSVPPETPIVNLRDGQFDDEQLGRLVRGRNAFLLVPPPETVHHEPRRGETIRILEQLGWSFTVERSGDSCCLARIWPGGRQ